MTAAARSSTARSRSCSAWARTGRSCCRRWSLHVARSCCSSARSAGGTACPRGRRRWSASLLLVFGSGWENIVFAIQITYNLSLLGFLAQVAADRPRRPAGPPRRRRGGARRAVGVMSSGFGPFFIVGIARVPRPAPPVGAARASSPHRRRWLYGWWWLTWGDDPVGATSAHGRRVAGPLRSPPAGSPPRSNGADRGRSLSPGHRAARRRSPCASGVRVAWRVQTTAPRPRRHGACVMFLGVGLQRVGLGHRHRRPSSRYVYMAAMLLAPALGARRRPARPLRTAGRSSSATR